MKYRILRSLLALEWIFVDSSNWQILLAMRMLGPQTNETVFELNSEELRFLSIWKERPSENYSFVAVISTLRLGQGLSFVYQNKNKTYETSFTCENIKNGIIFSKHCLY